MVLPFIISVHPEMSPTLQLVVADAAKFYWMAAGWKLALPITGFPDGR